MESSRKIREKRVSRVKYLTLRLLLWWGVSVRPFLPANSTELRQPDLFGGIIVGVETVKILFSKAEAGASLNRNGN